MNDQLKFLHFGGLGNHDHSLGEVESWLKSNKTTVSTIRRNEHEKIWI